MGGADPREKRRDHPQGGPPKSFLATDYHDLSDLVSNSAQGDIQVNQSGNFTALRHMTITVPEFKQRQGQQRGNELQWRKAVVAAASAIKCIHAPNHPTGKIIQGYA